MLKRTPLKRGTKQLKRSPLKRKPKTKEQIDAQKEQSSKDMEFYERIWRKRPHFCEETGVYLGDELNTSFFHHLLYKSKYPQFRYMEWNIMLISLDTHTQTHMDISKTPKIKYKTDLILSKL